MRRVAGKIIPGTLRIVVHEYQQAMAECCNCGHKQEVFPNNKTARCKGCLRVMVLRQAADVENVISIRRA